MRVRSSPASQRTVSSASSYTPNNFFQPQILLLWLILIWARLRLLGPFAARPARSTALLSFAFDQVRFFALERLALLEVFITIEVNLAFDYRQLRHGVYRKRMLAEDHQVGVFANVN